MNLDLVSFAAGLFCGWFVTSAVVIGWLAWTWKAWRT